MAVSDESEVIVAFSTAPSIEEASALAEAIVAKGLAACVQIVPNIESIYFWEGSVRRDPEALILIKTTKAKAPELEEFISIEHSYETPEFVSVPATNVSPKYRKWIDSVLARPL